MWMTHWKIWKPIINTYYMLYLSGLSLTTLRRIRISNSILKMPVSLLFRHTDNRREREIINVRCDGSCRLGFFFLKWLKSTCLIDNAWTGGDLLTRNNNNNKNENEHSFVHHRSKFLRNQPFTRTKPFFSFEFSIFNKKFLHIIILNVVERFFLFSGNYVPL